MSSEGEDSSYSDEEFEEEPGQSDDGHDDAQEAEADPGPSAYPEFESEEARVNSFEGWPYCDIISHLLLAKSGQFWEYKTLKEGTKAYYMVQKALEKFPDCILKELPDRTVCFHCGNALQNWVKGQDPWVYHVDMFTDCGARKKIQANAVPQNGACAAAKDEIPGNAAAAADDIVRDVAESEETAGMQAELSE